MLLIDKITVSLNLILALISFFINYLAAKDGLPRQILQHVTIAVFSIVFVLFYMSWLLMSRTEQEILSSVMRGLSLIIWVVVWIKPAYVSIKLWKELHKAVIDRKNQ